MRERFLIIDFLKGFSIFAIIIYHTLQFFPLPYPFDKAIAFGGSGVHTFFLVSGFGLFFSNQIRIKYLDFLKKRFDKIYLPYIIVVIVSAIIGIFIPIFDNPSFYAFFGHVFFYKMFDNDITISYGHQLWFVSTIIQFYLFFPLLKKLLDRLSIKNFLLLGFVISFCWSVTVFLLHKSEERIWNSFFLQFLWEFMIGMALAKLKDKSFLTKKYNLFYLILISFTALGFQILLILKGGQIGHLFNDVFGLIAFTGIAVVVYTLGIPLINKFFLFTGKISYSLYLLHVLVINILIYCLGFYNINLIVILVSAFLINYLLSFYYNVFLGRLYVLIKKYSDLNNHNE